MDGQRQNNNPLQISLAGDNMASFASIITVLFSLRSLWIVILAGSLLNYLSWEELDVIRNCQLSLPVVGFEPMTVSKRSQWLTSQQQYSLDYYCIQNTTKKHRRLRFCLRLLQIQLSYCIFSNRALQTGIQILATSILFQFYVNM